MTELNDAMEVVEAGNKAAEALRGKDISASAPTGFRTFVCPTRPNSRFLVQKGSVIMAPYSAGGGVIGLQPATHRDGDIFARFVSRICTTDDPVIIQWLEAHSGDAGAHSEYHQAKGENPRDCHVPVGLCREQGPGIDAWAQFKEGQMDTARNSHSIDPSIDIDTLLQGGSPALKTGSGAAAAKSAKANSAAADEREQGNQREVN